MSFVKSTTVVWQFFFQKGPIPLQAPARSIRFVFKKLRPFVFSEYTKEMDNTSLFLISERVIPVDGIATAGSSTETPSQTLLYQVENLIWENIIE